jgi:hypothetical protein
MDEEEVAFLFELLETTKRTLRALRLQKASFGIGAPSHIDLGIRQAEKDILVLKGKLETIQPSQIVTEAVGPSDTGALLVEHRVKMLDEKVGDALKQITEKVSEVADQVVQIADQVTRIDVVTEERYTHEQKIRKDRQQEHDERMTTIEQVQAETRDLVSALARRIGGMWWLIFDTAAIVGLVVAFVMWWFG